MIKPLPLSGTLFLATLHLACGSGTAALAGGDSGSDAGSGVGDAALFDEATRDAASGDVPPVTD